MPGSGAIFVPGDPGTFAASYVFSADLGDLDPFLHGVIVGRGVRVRERPSLEGPILAYLSFDAVPVAGD